MLNVMRENLRHLKVVLWVVAASMVLYLGAFFSCEDPRVTSGEWAALVGGSPISAERFRQAARNLDQQYRTTFGEQYESLRPSLRIGSQAINGLIVNELIHRDAKAMGLTVGPEELAESIRSTPELQQNGQFVGFEVYEEVLKRNYPGGVAAFEKAVASDLIVRKWTDVMTQSVRVSDAELENLHRRRTEKTAIDYVIVNSSDQEIDGEIPSAELTAWYEEHQDDYRRQPGRKIRYMEISREQLAATVGVTEDEMRASYEANLPSYTHGDQRRARHILLRVEPDADDTQKAEIRANADSILARLQAGEPFEPLAQTLSEDPISAARGGDLDFFERERMVPEFADAVFSTAVGELAPVTETQFGFHIIQVTDARAAGTAPFEQVRADIESRLKSRRTQEKVASESDRIAARLTSGESFDGVATAEGLDVGERFVERGNTLSELGVIRPDAVDQIFALAPGETSAPLDTRSGKILVTVTEVTEASVAPFEEVESQVRRDVLEEKMRASAYDMATTATSGDWQLASVAKTLGLEVQDSGDLAPGTTPAGSGGDSEELQALLFGDQVQIGDRGVVRVPAGALLYAVTGREPFDEVSFESAKPALTVELESDRKNALRESILTKLRDRHEVEINQTLVGQIDGIR